MECREFLAHFSQLYDGELDTGEGEALREHLRSCASCAHYHRVVARGVQILREATPPLTPPADFRPRLEHRLFHVADAEALLRGPSGSGVSAVTAAALALLLVVVAWSPLLQSGDPEVELPAIVVDQLSDPPRAAVTSAPTPAGSWEVPPSLRELSLWRSPRASLYQYSPLSNPHSSSGVVRTGLE